MQDKSFFSYPDYINKWSDEQAIIAMLNSWMLFKADFQAFYLKVQETSELHDSILLNPNEVTKAYLRFCHIVDKFPKAVWSKDEQRQVLLGLLHALLSCDVLLTHAEVKAGLDRQAIAALYVMNVYSALCKQATGQVPHLNWDWIQTNWQSFIENMKEHYANGDLMFFNLFEAEHGKA